MIGYIYLTENLVNHRIYIGKHTSDTYDGAYLGSGKILKQAVKKYGKENFSNVMLYEADTIDELNDAEIIYIQLFRNFYGDAIYNIARGGDGGDVFQYSDAPHKQSFVRKMTAINRDRCSSEGFKSRISQVTSERFKSQLERDRQSAIVKKAWADDALREKQREILKKYYTSHKKDNSYLCKHCLLELHGECFEFESRKELESFLSTKYSLAINRKLFTHLLNTGEPYRPFHKNKLGFFNGMRVCYLQQNENVETIGDECNRVGCEIGTHSKRKTR